MQRTYVGALARGHVHLPTRDAEFVRGEPIEVTAEEAAVLNADEWAVKPAADKPAQPEPDKPAKGQSKES